MESDQHNWRRPWPATIDEVIGDVEAVDDPELNAAVERLAQQMAEAVMSSRGVGSTTSILDYRKVIPGWKSEMRAAAIEVKAPVQHFSDEVLGIDFVRSTDGRETQVVVTSDGTTLGADDVVVIRILTGSDIANLLVLVRQQVDGTLRGEIVTPLVRMSDDVEIAIERVDLLSGEYADSVEHAVRASTAAGRNAWRRIARGLPVGHPIRVAVLAAFR